MNSNENGFKMNFFFIENFEIYCIPFFGRKKKALYLFKHIVICARAWLNICVCACLRTTALTCKVATLDDEMVKCLTIRSTYAQSSTKHWLLFDWNLTFILQHCYHHNFGSMCVCACWSVQLVHRNKKTVSPRSCTYTHTHT